MDLSNLSDADLEALASGDMSKVSDDGLVMLSGGQATGTSGGPLSRNSPRRKPFDYATDPSTAFARGADMASRDVLHQVSNAVVGTPAKGIAGLANLAVGRPANSADAWIDRNMVIQDGGGKPVIAEGIRDTLSPFSEAVSKADSWLYEKAPTTATAIGTAGEILNRGLMAAPVFQAAGAAGTEVRNLANSAMRLTPENRATAKAGDIARQAAGGNLRSIQDAMANSPDNLTAGQAASGINQDTWQSLAALAERNDTTSFYRKLRDAQEASRQGALTSVTPNLENAIAARADVSGPHYASAANATADMNGQLAAAIERLPKGILSSAKELARVEGRPFIWNPDRASVSSPSSRNLSGPADGSFGLASDNSGVMLGSAVSQAQQKVALPQISQASRSTGNPMAGAGIADRPDQISGDALHYIKLALDEAGKTRVGASAEDAVVSRAARSLRDQYLKAVEQAIPQYGTARRLYAERSAPVNQSQVLKEMSDTLANKTGGERVTPFLNAVEGSRSPLLKTALGDNRYTAADLPKVLNPGQMAVVDDIVSQLKRDAGLASQAQSGAGGMARILDENQSNFRIPHFLNRNAAITNNVLARAEATINKRVLDKLVEGMKNGQSANKLIAGLTPAEKLELSAFAKSAPRTIASSSLVNALAERKSKENR